MPSLFQVLIPPAGTVVDVLAVDNRFTEFVRLMKISGMADQLQKKGPYTVLAPTNKVKLSEGCAVRQKFSSRCWMSTFYTGIGKFNPRIELDLHK